MLPDTYYLYPAYYPCASGVESDFVPPDSSVYSSSEPYIVWNGMDDKGKRVSNGIYFCKLEMKRDVYIKKIVIIK